MEPKINQSNETDNPRPNKKVTRSWSSVKPIVDGIDALANQIKKDTGLHCDRSKLLNALSEAAIEAGMHIDTSRIVDKETLKEALIHAMKKKHK